MVDFIAVVAVVGIAVALVLVLLPMLGSPRGAGSRYMANSTQLRGIHQGFVTFAQSNKKGGNDGYFPGFDSSGNVIPDGADTGHSGDGTMPGARLWMMLEGNFFTPDYIINPADPIAFEAMLGPSGEYEPITADHFSYAMLGLASPDDSREREWKETLNTSAIVIGDRAIGTGRSDISSVWTATGGGDWRGGVTRNDNSTSFETSAEFEQTKYGYAPANALDHVFEDAPPTTPTPPDDPATPHLDESLNADAFLIHADATTGYNAD